MVIFVTKYIYGNFCHELSKTSTCTFDMFIVYWIIAYIVLISLDLWAVKWIGE